MPKYLADHSSRAIEIVDGDGCRLVDRSGKTYIDFIAGWCVGNVGWKRKEIRDAIEAEARRGLYVPQFFRSEDQEAFAELLVKHAPQKGLTRVYRCTSGSEAVEFAIKLARASTGRSAIVSVEDVYHGHTYGAASVGDACRSRSFSPSVGCGGMGPCLPDCFKIPMPNSRLGVTTEDAVAAFERIAEEHDVAAFLSEPVWTNAGAYVPPPDFYPAIERVCRKRGILLVMDEVATGFGRCGRLFASELWGIRPDIVCLAKGLTGGYAAMGAVLVTDDVFACGKLVPSYSTFGWILSDLAAARANVECILREQLWKNAERMGARLRRKLEPLATHPNVAEVRGIGLVVGVEIVKDLSSNAPDVRRAVAIQDACAKLGLLVETAGNAIFMTPPLIITEDLVDEGARLLIEAMG